MKHDDDLVSQGSPQEERRATSGGADSLASAMNAVLKAAKPLDALHSAQQQAMARQKACWDAFLPLCLLPDTEDRALIERFVEIAEGAYLPWHDANEAANAAKRDLRNAEREFEKAHHELNAACEAASKDEALTDDKTLAAARHMLVLTGRHRSRVEGKWRDALERADITPEDEEALAKLRSAAVDFILTEALVKSRDAVLRPIVEELYYGPRLANVPLPVRPLEEEIVRYLSNLENNLQRQQELKRQAYPLLKQRLTMVGSFQQWLTTLNDVFEAALNGPRKAALYVHIQALKEIVDQVRNRSAKGQFEGWYYYECGFCQDPDSMETHDRPRSTAVERDQIDYLRKQMRVVAFAVAHREEATHTLLHFRVVEKKVTPQGVENCSNWAECLEWFEALRKRRHAAELENLSSSTKAELLKSTVEHWKAKAIDEMTTLLKSFSAMIPHNGPKPSNELRKLLDQAEHMCLPLTPQYRDR